MRHQKHRQRLTQKPAHARMLKRNLVTSLLLYESIRTTKNRAKVIQPIIDQLVTYAKKNPPHIAIRYINRVVTDKNASRKIMEVYRDRYKTRTSGLSRIVPAGVRVGDGAMLVDITLIDAVIGTPAKEEKVSKEAKETKVTKEKDTSSTSTTSKTSNTSKK
ncbi:MAG: bL17 family ribosomal protein [bacterium]|nr:bL17 family ribosomal protein [bacterium]